MKYLDPKSDLTFKKVFGEHPALLISFLNAMLPLEEGGEIEEIEYLSPELIPDYPLHKYTIVDVRCRDKRKRQFLVEMQIVWTPDFQKRVLFNATKAYSHQIDAGRQYKLLQPVYSLNLIDQVFEPDLPTYYHLYQLQHTEFPERKLEGLEFVFVELPKYSPRTFTEKKMKVLWMRYLTEIKDHTETIPAELLEVPEIKEAVEILKESAFSEAELYTIDRFWDEVQREEMIRDGSLKQGRKEGREEGRKEGFEEGIAQSEAKVKAAEAKAEAAKADKEAAEAKFLETARNLKAAGVATEIIINATGLSREVIEQL
jgi:predicted transposase/invertase (TIGR01784 family)